MRKDTIVFVCFVFGAIIALPISAQEQSPTEKLQSQRTDAIDSLQKFMMRIGKLEQKAQEKLLRARLTNTHIEYENSEPWEGIPEPYFLETLSFEKTSWILTSVLYVHEYTEEGKYGRPFRLEITLVLPPNSIMLEWKQLFDEYVGYSKQKLGVEDIRLDVSGTIESFEWRQSLGGGFKTSDLQPSRDSIDSLDPDAVMIDCRLTLKLKPFEAKRIATKTKRFPIATHIQLLKDKIAEWVKYYMDKGPKPKLLRSSK